MTKCIRREHFRVVRTKNGKVVKRVKAHIVKKKKKKRLWGFF